MTHFQSLESRMLMSVSATTLGADYSAILADRAPITAAVTPISSALTAGTKTIVADLKGTVGRSQIVGNNRLVAQVRIGEIRLLAALRLDASILTGHGTLLSAAAKAAGIVFLQKATTLRSARVTTTASNLSTAVAAELATLLGDGHDALLNADLDAITAANSSNTQLAGDIAALKSSVTLQPFDTAAQTFATATQTLATDLNTLVAPQPTFMIFTSRAAFDAAAAALGTITTEGYENYADDVEVGARTINLSNFSVSYDLNGDVSDFGVSDDPNAAVGGGSGLGPTAGTKCLVVTYPTAAVPKATATFAFATPIKAFGTDVVDLENAALSFITSSGGTGTAATAGANGNVQFFGVISNVPFTSVGLSEPGVTTGDAVDFDQTSFV